MPELGRKKQQSMDELYAMPGHLIRRAQQLSTALFSEACASFDLTSVQFAALHAIGLHPGVDATRLSALIAFDRSTIGDVVDRLQQKGWVERAPSPRDRRVKLIGLSPEGAALLRQVRPHVRRVQERILAPLDPGERDSFTRLLRKLTHPCAEPDSVPGPGQQDREVHHVPE